MAEGAAQGKSVRSARRQARANVKLTTFEKARSLSIWPVRILIIVTLRQSRFGARAGMPCSLPSGYRSRVVRSLKYKTITTNQRFTAVVIHSSRGLNRVPLPSQAGNITQQLTAAT